MNQVHGSLLLERAANDMDLIMQGFRSATLVGEVAQTDNVPVPGVA